MGADVGRPAAVLLPGILMPATQRYAPLQAALERTGVQVDVLTKDLEVYAGDGPGPDYSLQVEVDGLQRFADDRGLQEFHLYGHSAGGSVALTYAAQHPDRLLSLALDEPATDFSASDRSLIERDLPGRLGELPVPERMRVFARSLVRPGVELPAPPAPPPGPPDPEAAKRPAGLAAMEAAMLTHEVDQQALERLAAPVYFSYGSLSSDRWEEMARRAAATFRTCTVECYDGIHHLHTSHQAQPTRVAEALQSLWSSTGGARA